MTASKAAVVSVEHIALSILVLRSQRVLLDAELAELYGVSTKALNQAVKRKVERFPWRFHVHRSTATCGFCHTPSPSMAPLCRPRS